MKYQQNKSKIISAIDICGIFFLVNSVFNIFFPLGNFLSQMRQRDRQEGVAMERERGGGRGE